jgi:cyclase
VQKDVSESGTPLLAPTTPAIIALVVDGEPSAHGTRSPPHRNATGSSEASTIMRSTSKAARFAVVLASCLTLGPSISRAAQDDGDVSNVRLNRISPRVLELTFGSSYPTHVVALAAAKGIVVIDTTFLPSLAEKMKGMIAREFKRHDFLYVINTHFHSDHTTGNVAFPESLVIAHASAKSNMVREYGDVRAYREWLRITIKQRGRGLETLSPDSLQHGVIKEGNALMNEALDEVGHDFVFRTPDIEFEGELHLDLGDLNVRLTRFGTNLHTTTDIFIHVLEEHLLMTGDLFAGEWLPEISPSQPVAEQIALLGKAYSDYSSVEVVVPAHFSEYRPEYFRMARDYTEKVLTRVKSLRAQGRTLEEVKRELSISSAFPEVAGLLDNFMGTDIHASNIETTWKELERTR